MKLFHKLFSDFFPFIFKKHSPFHQWNFVFNQDTLVINWESSTIENFIVRYYVWVVIEEQQWVVLKYRK